MLALRKWPLFGLQLFIFLHTSESFVLLTANIDDVKKLATKFVSESLADKIATFIAQAAQNVMIPQSAETQRDVSEENKKYNIKQPMSNELRTEEQRPRKDDVKDHKKKFYFIQGDVVSRGQDDIMSVKKKKIHNKMKSQPVARTNSIEDNNVDGQLNKTINRVIELNLKPEANQNLKPEANQNLKPEANQKLDSGKEKKTNHHQRHEYKLLATSGNMILTRVISSRESNENHGSTKKKSN
ncbi:unnamed protein product [Arctia plantaginis]|uniref:Uncharacterized protein n=1 Tax=Arctia plantaginis TaxID=874455 RepID=A0A8S1BH32_ARCPL|nr:unnamed protein product [Arctia plantaginis]